MFTYYIICCLNKCLRTHYQKSISENQIRDVWYNNIATIVKIENYQVHQEWVKIIKWFKSVILSFSWSMTYKLIRTVSYILIKSEFLRTHEWVLCKQKWFVSLPAQKSYKAHVLFPTPTSSSVWMERPLRAYTRAESTYKSVYVPEWPMKVRNKHSFYQFT